MIETIHPAKLEIPPGPSQKKVYLPLLKRFKLWTNHNYNEAPLQEDRKSNLFSEYNEDIILFTLIFSKYNMEFSRGYVMCDVTTDDMQKQTQNTTLSP